MNSFIRNLSGTRLNDLPEVGGKIASLGEMISMLSQKGITVPDGFAITASAFKYFLEFENNHLTTRLKEVLNDLDKKNYSNLRETGSLCRKLIIQAKMPDEIKHEIYNAYKKLRSNGTSSAAIRSSATAEDLPEASFAGQHDSFLNVSSVEDVVLAVQKCYASLYTDRAIKYREDKGFDHEKVALAVCVQTMVRSDKSCSGVAFTLEPESGFRDVIHISGVWGLGENLVQGTVNPDEFILFKPTLLKGKNPIIQKRLGDKLKTMVYSSRSNSNPVTNIKTPRLKQQQYVLDDPELIQLAKWCITIEQHYGKPMDIEWAKDGLTNKLFIIQARPETVQSVKDVRILSEYRLLEIKSPIVTGQAIGSKVATGIARIVNSPTDAGKLQKGDIVVTDLTSPDWDPILKTSSAIITNKGGRTSHASIVARELGVPAVVGCDNATERIEDGVMITVSCCEGKTGKIYKGKIPFEIIEKDFSAITMPEATEAMLIVGDPDQAFRLSFYPNDGVGLLRIEFIINHLVQVHPMALVRFDELKDPIIRKRIEQLTQHSTDKKEYFVNKLAEGIATIAAAFYPKDVIVRTSDFKTNEYANLIGGAAFEPREENPMIGFRGASRYYHELYKEGFALECASIKKVREDMGFDNVKVMIPFCRTINEAKKVLQAMKENGLDRAMDDSLSIYMMAEIPSNVLLAEKFATLFDGFSIGSNDLTQLTLGIDRDSAIVNDLFSEKDEAASMMIGMMIEKAINACVKVGLCGQAPSDYPEFAKFLVEKRINSISFNPDSLLKGIENITQAEKNIKDSAQEEEIMTF